MVRFIEYSLDTKMDVIELRRITVYRFFSIIVNI